MKSTRTNQTQLRTLFFGMLCLLAGVMCVAKGFSHNSANLPSAVSATPGERQGVSPPCRSPWLDSAGNPQFTSLTARYVTKRIADLEVGEDVVAKDPESREVTTKRVANVFRKVSDHLRVLQVRNPLTNEVQTIETTDDHPFWIAARGQWIAAKDLKVGDRLDDVDGGIAILESTSRELHPEGIPVFNFEVEDFHTYFVRAHGTRGPPLLTHNTDCGETIVFALRPNGNEAYLNRLALDYNGITYRSFRDKGLVVDDLSNPHLEPSLFKSGVQQAVTDRRVKRIVFGLDEGFDLRNAADGMKSRIVDGSYTSHELKIVLNHATQLRMRGVDVRFVRGGREYQYLFDTFPDPPAGLSVKELDRHGSALNSIFKEIR